MPKKKTSRSKLSEVTCRKVAMLIDDYVNLKLDKRTSKKFTEHIGDCVDCLAFLNTYRSTMSIANSLSYETLPPDLQERALQFIVTKQKK